MPQAKQKRGALLTIFAILLVLLSIEDFLKPFGLEGPTTGIVFLGHRFQGNAAFLGWLVGTFLVVYAIGIWTMRRYALTLAYVYGVYVVLNIGIFLLTGPPPDSPGQMAFGIVYSTLAIGGAWALAFLLRRRKEQLA